MNLFLFGLLGSVIVALILIWMEEEYVANGGTVAEIESVVW